jgi:hypothetical protein
MLSVSLEAKKQTWEMEKEAETNYWLSEASRTLMVDFDDEYGKAKRESIF